MSKTPELYPDQEATVKDLRLAMREYRSILLQASTGWGKTVVASYMADRVSSRGKRMIFCVHRRDLVRQTAKTFADWGIHYGVIAAGYAPNLNAQIQIASIETLRRRLDNVRQYDLLYVDECHLACSPTWTQVISHFRAAGSLIIGNTATPERLDGRPLGMHFETIVQALPMRDLIDMGRLSDYRIFAPSAPDLSGVGTARGDFKKDELEVVTDTRQITGDAITHYRKLMPGRRAIAFCVSIRHAEHVAEQFRGAGIPAERIDGAMDDKERRRIITDFADGRIHVLTNVELITTGFDLSSQVGRDVPVEGGIMLRATQSVALHLQMIGRCLRKKPHPAIILDHVNGTVTHGLPCDEREWSLEGRVKRKKAGENGPSLRTCEECFAVYPVKKSQCPSCGAMAVSSGGTGVPQVVDGELSEIDVARIRADKKREEYLAFKAGLPAAVALAKGRGYKPGWVGMGWVARNRKAKLGEIMEEVYKLWKEVA